MFEISVLRTIEELRCVREFWLASPGNRDSHYEYFLTVLRESAATQRPHVIVVKAHGEPQAILVGRVDHAALDCRIGYAHLRPRASLLYFVYGALRGDNSGPICELLVDEVRRALAEGEADAAYLNFIDTNSPLYTSATTRPGHVCRDRVVVEQPHYALSLPPGREDYYARFSSKVRKNFKWQARKFERDCEQLQIRCFLDPHSVGQLVEDAECVAKKSYQRGLGVGFADTPAVRARMLMKANQGWLRGYVLYVADQPCAFWIGDKNDTTFGSEYLGFDPAYAQYSPGIYLLNQVIEGFCGSVDPFVTRVDFATGEAHYKRILSTENWNERAVYIFSPSFKGIRLNTCRSLTGFADRSMRLALEKTHLLGHLKRAWRTRVTEG